MLNANGDTIWTKRNLSFSGKVKATTDGKFIFIGGNNAGQAYDTIYVTKTDINGSIEWRKQVFYGVCHNTVTDVLVLADGSFILTGYYADKSCSNPTYDAFILKLDANGNKVWEKIVAGAMNEQLYVLKELPDGCYAAFGWTNSITENNNADYMLIKFSPNGNELWRRYYGDAGDNYGYGMEVLPDGSFAMVGYTTELELIKANSDGIIQWKKTYGTAAGSTNFKVSYTSDAGLAILGSENNNGQMNAVFMKTDLDGAVLWKKNWAARLREFRENTDGSFVLTGYAHYLPDVAVIMMDSTKFQKAPDTLAVTPVTPPHPVQMRDTSSNTTGISTTATDNYDNLFKLYPNPASNKVFIEFSNKNNDTYTLELYNMAGQLMRMEPSITGTKIVIDRNDMSSGIYTYKLTGGGNTFAGKFVFQ